MSEEEPATPRRRVVFRADAGRRIGGGHVMRCLTLAEQLTAQGWTARFACSPETSIVVPRLRETVDLLAAEDLDPSRLARHWPDGCAVLVVDHYGLDRSFEAAMRGWAKRIVVIDDLADRAHDCDMLVDTNLGRRPGDYAGLIPPGAKTLVGPAYALLRPTFAAHRMASIRRSAQGDARTILVSLGLTDIGGMTETVVRALLTLPARFTITVLIGGGAPSRAALVALAAREPRVRLHVDPPDVAALMAEADLAVGAGGTTSWERCTLGLPTVCLVLADNQRLVAASLEAAGAALNAPPFPAGGGRDFVESVRGLLDDRPRLQAMAAAAAAIADGRGAARVAAALSRRAPAARSIEIRAAEADDSALIWAWRNDPVSRANSKNGAPVPFAEHEAWFAAWLEDPDRFAYIGLAEAEPFGIVRFDRLEARDFRVGINLAPHRRGEGLGRSFLDLSCSTVAKTFAGARFHAEIKRANTGSQRLFESCRFEAAASIGELTTYRRVSEG